MNNEISFNTSGITMADIVTFSTKYLENINDIWAKLQKMASEQPKTGITLSFLRANGEFKEETATIQNLNAADKRFDFGRYGDDGEGGQVFSGRTIRLDNVFGEIPVLLGFSYSTIFCFGKKIETYRNFMEKVLAADFHNQYATLSYRNNDGSISEIYCLIKKTNRSNFETVDYRETSLSTNNDKGITLKGTNGMQDVHRFVSQVGYLYKIAETTMQTFSHFDDGEVFGRTGS